MRKSARSAVLIALLGWLFAGSALRAQYPAPSPTATVAVSPKPATPAAAPSKTILLDPAHGGPESGATITGSVLEKDATRAFAQRLRALLVPTFSVATTRDLDSDILTAALTPDQRAGIANRNPHPLACILIHATASGSGVHISPSALAPGDPFGDPRAIVPWSTAQAAALPQSLRLANDLGVALQRSHVTVVVVPASIPPLDNLTSPAIVLELAPLTNGSGSTPATDAGYQQRVAEAVASALVLFRDQTAAILNAARKPQSPGALPSAATQKPAARPRPATTSPDGLPAAPIVRRRPVQAAPGGSPPGSPPGPPPGSPPPGSPPGAAR